MLQLDRFHLKDISQEQNDREPIRRPPRQTIQVSVRQINEVVHNIDVLLGASLQGGLPNRPQLDACQNHDGSVYSGSVDVTKSRGMLLGYDTPVQTLLNPVLQFIFSRATAFAVLLAGFGGFRPVVQVTVCKLVTAYALKGQGTTHSTRSICTSGTD